MAPPLSAIAHVTTPAPPSDGVTPWPRPQPRLKGAVGGLAWGLFPAERDPEGTGGA